MEIIDAKFITFAYTGNMQSAPIKHGDPSSDVTSSANENVSLVIAARHINASVSRPITPVSLLQAIKTGAAEPGFDHHLFAFFDEIDEPTMMDIVISGAVTFNELKYSADRFLPDGHQTRNWLNEQC